MNNKDEKMIKLMKFGIPSLLVILVLGVTIAYFSSRGAVTTRSVTTANIKLDINPKDATIIGSNLSPTDESRRETEGAKKTFTVTTTNEETLYMSINLKDIVIDNELKVSDFKWELFEGTDSSGTTVASGNFNNVGESMNLEKDIKINSSTPKTYTLYIWIQNTEEDQNTMQEKNFKAKIDVVGYVEPIEPAPNSPVLASGMIPVVYDETSGNWEVADTNSEWYNYSEQKWANAVTTSDASYRTAEAGTEIPMSSINSMWVWIPRYKYKIPSDIGSSSNVTTPPEIDVVFEKGTNTTGESLAECPIDATDCYYTHPAFRDGSSVYETTAYDQGGWDEELEGIWVGKFETSGTSTTPTIKPDAISLRSQTLSTQFDTSLKFAGGTRNTSNGTITFSGNSTYGLTSTTDTHMMKNTEWGAVAYLSQSKYGKMGNPNYSGVNKEIYINNSYEYTGLNSIDTYTGRSGGSPNASPTTYGSYSYDDRICSNSTCTGSKEVGKGTGASTTGTIYGIYDMSGGAFEYVMGNWTGTVGSSGFTTSNFPGGSNGSKYYEKYTGTSFSSNSIKGDATYETMNWYSDEVGYFTTRNPWAVRGGDAYDIYAGIFNINDESSGINSDENTFRMLLIP